MSDLIPALRRVTGVVFDTDGVIIDSAKVHAAAWKSAFDAFLRECPPGDPTLERPFDVREDYLRYVDGKSRLDGAAAFLTSRGLHPPAATVQAVAASKEQIFAEHVHRCGVAAYPGTVRLLHVLRGRGVPCGAASASRHAGKLLEGAGVLDLFDALVDGGEAARLGLPGKPDPAIFVEAARRLGSPTVRTAVVEDALAGVEAGRRGGFGLVIGVDRGPGRTGTADLLLHGADLVVGDLTELLSDEAKG